MWKSLILFIGLCIFTTHAIEAYTIIDDNLLYCYRGSFVTKNREYVHVEYCDNSERSIAKIWKGRLSIFEIQTSVYIQRFMWTIVKPDNTCVITLKNENMTGCNEATSADDRYSSEDLYDINNQCQGKTIHFVRAVPCDSDHGVQGKDCKKHWARYYIVFKGLVDERTYYDLTWRYYIYCLQ